MNETAETYAIQQALMGDPNIAHYFAVERRLKDLRNKHESFAASAIKRYFDGLAFVNHEFVRKWKQQPYQFVVEWPFSYRYSEIQWEEIVPMFEHVLSEDKDDDQSNS